MVKNETSTPNWSGKNTFNQNYGIRFGFNVTAVNEVYDLMLSKNILTQHEISGVLMLGSFGSFLCSCLAIKNDGQ